MLKKDIPHEQFNLFGLSTRTEEPKKIKNKLSPEKRTENKEKNEAHTAWKLLKSGRFDEFLTDKHKFLLQKYYGIKL